MQSKQVTITELNYISCIIHYRLLWLPAHGAVSLPMLMNTLIKAVWAGGTVTDFSGNKFSPYQPHILATNGSIYNELLAVINNVKVL